MTEPVQPTTICPLCGEEIEEGDGTEQGGDIYHFWCLANGDGDND